MFLWIDHPGNDSNYDIWKEENKTISLNNIVRVKVKKSICQGRVTKIPFSDRKEDSEYLEIK